MRYFAVILAILCTLPAHFVAAQESSEEPIETDRDSFTPSTTTAGAERLILESSYSFIDNRDAPETHSFPEFLGRYGVDNWLEFRFGANYEIGGESNSVSGGGGDLGDFEPGGIESEANVLYGIKAAVTEPEGWIPRSAVILHGITPTSGPETETHFVATYVWGWTLVEGWMWDSAIRYGDALDDKDHFNRWAPSTVLKVSVAEKWNAHIEYFGIFTEGRDDELSQSYVSPGLHYLVTPDVELGVRVGWGLGDDAANFFTNVGAGVRF